MGPTYRANVSQADQDVVLDFFPGPIRAEDGDRGINAPLTYAILSGDDQGRFVMDSRTGEVRLTRAVGPGRPAANYTLSVMVSQVDDRLKYSVASVLVRVLCENRFPPTFNRTTFKGFIIQSSSPASIVSTFGNQVLQVQVEDQDFPDGVNPNIRYQVRPPSHLFQVIQDGVLIARSDQLRAFDRHILQVVARDEESGEEVSASVDIEVLQRGQAVPRGAFTEQRLLGDLDSRLAGGLALLVVLVLSGVLLVLVWTLRRRRLQGPQEAVGNPPDLAGGGLPLGGGPGGASQGGGLLGWPLGGGPGGASQGGGLLGRQGVYTRRTSLVQDPAARRLFLVMEEAGGGKGGGASWAEPGGGASWAEGGGGASWEEGGASWEEGGDVESQMDEEVKMDLL
ncbi:cadherin EGF LAG seven-pass G-type receptor 2 isoform 3-T3 [Menidia menidia]